MNHLGVWAITVGGYGTFEYVSTEDEAEEMRRCSPTLSSPLKSRLRDASELELRVWNESGGPFSVDNPPERAGRAKEKVTKKKAAKKKRSNRRKRQHGQTSEQ